jgi:hypothetical protein
MALVDFNTIPGVKQIPDFPGYWASPDGRIFSQRHRWGIQTAGSTTQLKPYNWMNGYLAVRLYVNAKRMAMPIHTLMMRTFVGPRQDGMECRHLDGNRHNNVFDNLQWGTHTENAADMVKHGRTWRGVRNCNAKLTDKQVCSIRQRVASGETRIAIARELCLSRDTIQRVVNCTSWQHVQSLTNSG